MDDIKDKPIAILTVKDEVSKMNKRQRDRLCKWLRTLAGDVERDYAKYGKCRMRLMR